MSILVCENVYKSFGSFTAVNNVSLKIEPGECFGLLGPNGAGKSTLIRLLYGASPRTQGAITVLGFDPEKQGREVRARMGVVTQDNNLDKAMTVRENMLMYARYVGLPKAEIAERVDELLDYMLLSHKGDEVIEALSGGMQRRLVFVRALLGKPQILILDEPTTGLDPAVRQLLWDKVIDLKAKGVTVLLTTHYMDEAEALCDRLVIIDQGEVKEAGPPQQLIEKNCPGFVAVLPKAGRSLLKTELPGIDLIEDNNQFIAQSNELSVLTEAFSSASIKPLLIRPSNLEDVFLKVTGRELTENA